MPCFAVLLFFVLVAIAVLVFLFGLAVVATGVVTIIVQRRRGFGVIAGILLALAGAVIVVVPLRWEYDFFVGDDLRRKEEAAREDRIRVAMKKDLRALAAAEFAYQSANGGYFGVPERLGIGSLKNRDGYELTFFPGPAPPRQVRTEGMAAFAIVARRKRTITVDDYSGHKISQVEQTAFCVDLRNKVCESYAVEPQGAFCACYAFDAQHQPVEPAVLGFTHIDGVSPCPHRVGTIHVHNDSEAEITTDVRYMFAGRMVGSGAGRLPAAPLLFDGSPTAMPWGSSWDPRGIPVGPWSNARIPAHGSGEITVDYNCTATGDFAIDVFVLKDQKVTIYGTINP